MLGFAPLGALALGQLPSELGVAQGATLTLSITLVAGAAIGEGQQPPITIVRPGQPYVGRDGVARGARFDLWVALQPGRAVGVQRVDATAGGVVLQRTMSIAAGGAEGNAIGYDNTLLLLLAA